ASPYFHSSQLCHYRRFQHPRHSCHCSCRLYASLVLAFQSLVLPALVSLPVVEQGLQSWTEPTPRTSRQTLRHTYHHPPSQTSHSASRRNGPRRSGSPYSRLSPP
ncbi:unnamed protein product, partial [Ectocarpus sp. 12 AP-2014]